MTDRERARDAAEAVRMNAKLFWYDYKDGKDSVLKCNGVHVAEVWLSGNSWLARYGIDGAAPRSFPSCARAKRWVEARFKVRNL